MEDTLSLNVVLSGASLAMWRTLPPLVTKTPAGDVPLQPDELATSIVKEWLRANARL